MTVMFSVIVAILLQMSPEVIQYPLVTGNCSAGYSVPSGNMIRVHWHLSEEYLLFSEVTLTPYRKFFRGLQTFIVPGEKFTRGLPIITGKHLPEVAPLPCPGSTFGVCSTDLWLDTSPNGLKQVYTSPEAI